MRLIIVIVQPELTTGEDSQNSVAILPPPKTDKPRPHVCTTCDRSFARLEHLKRHERSHTKEKPFECPECSRCFARRDLLLRHQQKLHQTTLPSSRRRGARRESASSGAGGGAVRARKPVANADGGASGVVMRPRANTISHVDNATIGMLANADPSMAGLEGFNPRLGYQPSMSELPGVSGYSFRGMSTAVGHHGNHVALPRLETSGLNIGIGGTLKTAPPYGGPRGSIDMENAWLGPESTVNPAQLHFSNSPGSFVFDPPVSPFDQSFAAMPAAYAALDDEGNFTWFGGFENQPSFQNVNEQGVDESSPSVISTGSHSGLSEPMLDCSKNSNQPISLWPTSTLPQAPITPNLTMDWSMPAYQDTFAPGQLSPKSLQMQLGGADQYFPNPLPIRAPTPLSKFQGLCYPYFHPPMIIEPDNETPGNSMDSVSSSNRQSSMTSFSTELITDAVRQALLAILPASPVHGHDHLTVSLASMSSSSTAFGGSSQSVSNLFLPSTLDLQRYVTAYIKYFHPHLPFLHIPSLSFHCLVHVNDTRASTHHLGMAQSGSSGSGGSLLLAMAAIGALYEFEHPASNALFELAKKTMEEYLENNHAAGVAGESKGSCGTSNQPSDLWLIQAMALVVIYGHHRGENVSSEVASSQCATLVGLARESQHASIALDNSSGDVKNMSCINPYAFSHEAQLCIERPKSGNWGSEVGNESFRCQTEWYQWKLKEERKRTLYVVFIMSSLLISGHIHMPTLTNAEIRLALPCDEDMWAADSAESWMALGGKVVADIKETSFAAALSFLLTANERPQEQKQQQQQQQHTFKVEPSSNLSTDAVPERQFKPGTFGCLVLIHALHSYIWETRQRHMGRQWTTHETQQMHGRMEPALKAWEAMWNDNPNHSLDRTHLSGCGFLWTDCIPILDMAYLGLYVNLGCAKEAFWRRDYNAVADELARGPALVPVVSNNSSPLASTGHHVDGGFSAPTGSYFKSDSPDGAIFSQLGQHVVHTQHQYSNRERHLRQAAYCAANSIMTSIQMGRTTLDCDSRESPIQAATSFYDAAQILAEWVSTVQERVGRYLGILGTGYVDFCQVPVGLLDEEDCRLLEKVRGLVGSLEGRVASYGFTNSSLPNQMANELPGMEGWDFGSKLLAMTAFLLKMAPVWPGEF